VNEKVARGSRLAHQPTTESQKLSDMLRAWRHLAGHRLDHVVEAKLQTSGTGQAGSRIETTWLTRASQCSVSSSMPQTVILKEAVACIAIRAEHPRAAPANAPAKRSVE
jgi:hypothetical protein